jgi:hypothetical protein
MGFVQIIEFRTSKEDELRRLGDEWAAAAGAESKVVRRTVCRDRNDPTHYFNVVEFASYEDAMANSALPVTGEFAAKMVALADGTPTFHDLDVVDQA